LLVQKLGLDGNWANISLLDRVFIDPYVGVQSFFRNASTAVNGSMIESIQYLPRWVGMKRQANYTIEGIASEAGFASKSTFNLAFKKYHQCTPTEYFSKF
jgi:AraC-like DNA-binding protein